MTNLRTRQNTVETERSEFNLSPAVESANFWIRDMFSVAASEPGQLPDLG